MISQLKVDTHELIVFIFIFNLKIKKHTVDNSHENVLQYRGHHPLLL